MMVLLDLTTEQEEKLRQAALQRSLDTERLLHEVVDAALAQIEQPATARPAAHRTVAGGSDATGKHGSHLFELPGFSRLVKSSVYPLRRIFAVY